MRSLAPAFILTSIVALASGSALALGDMNKNKKSPTAESTSQVTTPSSSSSYNTAPSAPVAPGSSTATPNASVGANGSTSASMNGSTSATGSPGMGATTTARCDASKYPNRNDIPKDCLVKSGTGAAAVGSTQGQSGGDAGAGASGSAGSAGPSR